MPFDNQKHEDEFMTISELTKVLKISETTLRKLIRKGEIPGAKKFGGSWRVYREVFYKYLEENNFDLNTNKFVSKIENK